MVADEFCGDADQGEDVYTLARVAAVQPTAAAQPRRSQTDNGARWYHVSLSLWPTVSTPHGADRAEPFDVAFPVPATHVQPVPPASTTYPSPYVAAAPPSHAPAPAAPPPTPTPTPTEVHHVECFVGPRKAELTTDQALQALARPGATACTVSGAETALPHTKGSRSFVGMSAWATASRVCRSSTASRRRGRATHR
ncbi:DUF6233 domain-containing protein [Streptomyces sp. MAR4 CNX-425]|uniref:DUF6233 domain-containing protein n=1 Tax=Streptomyces sp. MAR4 CNX-425 TaxID=3406343 RepID=UPI003B501ECD